MPATTWPLSEQSDADVDRQHFWPLFVPAATPGATAVTEAGARSYMIVADGGERPRDALTLVAARLGPDVHISAAFDPGEVRTVLQYRSILWAVTGTALLIGFAAVAITALDRAVERRRQLATFHVLGAPDGVLRRSQLLQTLLPMVIGLPAAALAGLLAGHVYLRVGGDGGYTPVRAVLGTLALGTVAAAVVAAATLPGIGRRVTAEMLRRE